MRNHQVALARCSTRHPWRAIAGWFVFVALCLGGGLAIGGKAATTEDFRIGEAGRGEAMAASGGLAQRPVERVLITAGSGGRLDTAAADAAAREVTDRMRALPEVEAVAVPVYSADGSALRVDVTMAGPELEGKNHVAVLREQTAAARAAHPLLSIEETGGPSISSGVEELRGRDLARTELIAVPVTLLTLLVVFRSVAMALVPLALAISSIVAAAGLAMPASHVFPDNGVGLNIILLIGMAVGVDYTLFFLKRAREERVRGGRALRADELVELAAGTSGRAVVISGLAVVAATATSYLADDAIFSSIATAAILVTVVSVASSLTALPALLTVITARADRRGAHGAGRSGSRPESTGSGRFVTVVLSRVTANPVAALLISILALAALATPLLGLRLSDMGRETHPRSIAAMRTFDRLTTAYPELKSMHQVVVVAKPEQAQEVSDALRDLAERARSDPALTGTAELRTSADRRVSLLQLAVPHYVGEDAARASLARVRADYVPATVGAVRGAEVAVTGDVARYADYPAQQRRKLPLIVTALLLVTFAVTAAAFRSVVLGLLGVALNLLSTAASLGLLVLVFQHTWAETLLAFDSTGTIGSRIPLLLLMILFGLSMDYQIFVLSRIDEARRAGVPTRRAVIEGVAGSAGAVTGAAFIMMTVFASFVPLHIMEMKQMGFVLAAAVLLDAFVIRLALLPAALLLLGDRIWWPGRHAVTPIAVNVG